MVLEDVERVTARDPMAKFVVFIASQPRLESTVKAFTLRGVTHAVLSKATDSIATQVRGGMATSGSLRY